MTAPPLLCRRCGKELTPGHGSFYHIVLEALADPAPPDLSAVELEQDARPQIEALLEQLEGVSEQEAMDQVYRRQTFILCGRCYRGWIVNPTC